MWMRYRGNKFGYCTVLFIKVCIDDTFAHVAFDEYLQEITFKQILKQMASVDYP